MPVADPVRHTGRWQSPTKDGGESDPAGEGAVATTVDGAASGVAAVLPTSGCVPSSATRSGRPSALPWTGNRLVHEIDRATGGRPRASVTKIG